MHSVTSNQVLALKRTLTTMGRKGKKRGAAVEKVESWPVPCVSLRGKVLAEDSPLTSALESLASMRQQQLAPLPGVKPPVATDGEESEAAHVAALVKRVAEHGQPHGLLCNDRKLAHATARCGGVFSHRFALVVLSGAGVVSRLCSHAFVLWCTYERCVSYNDGKHRWVCVQPAVRVPCPGDELESTVWYIGHIELAGNAVDLAALRGCQGLPPQLLAKRRLRDGPRHHITLVSPPECETLLKEHIGLPLSSEERQAAIGAMMETIVSCIGCCAVGFGAHVSSTARLSGCACEQRLGRPGYRRAPKLSQQLRVLPRC